MCVYEFQSFIFYSVVAGWVLPFVALVASSVLAVVGQRLAPHLSDRRLRQGFSVLLIGSALLSGLEAWKRQPSPSAQRTPSHPTRLIARTSPPPIR